MEEGTYTPAAPVMASDSKIEDTCPNHSAIVTQAYGDILHKTDTALMNTKDLNTLVQVVLKSCYEYKKDETKILTQEQVHATLMSVLEVDGFNKDEDLSNRSLNQGKNKRKFMEVEEADHTAGDDNVAYIDNGARRGMKKKRTMGYTTMLGESNLPLAKRRPRKSYRDGPHGFITSHQSYLDPYLQENFIHLCYINVREGAWEFAQNNPNLKEVCDKKGWVSSISKDYQDWWFAFAEVDLRQGSIANRAAGGPPINKLWPKTHSIRHMYARPEFGIPVQTLVAVANTTYLFNSSLRQSYRATAFHEGVQKLESIIDYVAKREGENRKKRVAKIEEVFALRRLLVEQFHEYTDGLKDFDKESEADSNFLRANFDGMTHSKRQECLSQIKSTYVKMHFVEQAKHLKELNDQILEVTEELSLGEMHEPIPEEIVRPFRKWVDEQLQLALEMSCNVDRQDGN